MILYELYESQNGEKPRRIGVYLTAELAEQYAKRGAKSSHMTKDGWVEDTYSYEIKEIEKETSNVVFNIFIISPKSFYSDIGKRIFGLSLEKARDTYLQYSKNSYVELQLPQKQFGLMGVTKIESNIDERYWIMEKAFLDAKGVEENWRPGDAPWRAPGMSIKDFI